MLVYSQFNNCMCTCHVHDFVKRVYIKIVFLPSTSDIEKIRAGIGDKMAAFLFNASNSLTGYIIAFIFSWKLTLVTLTLQPVLAFMSGSVARVMLHAWMEK